MTYPNIILNAYTNNIRSHVLPRICSFSYIPSIWIPIYSILYDSMIPRCIFRRYSPRTSYICSTKGSNTRSSTIYCIRSIFLCELLLSILSQCTSSYSRTRISLTTTRYRTTITIRNSSTKYDYPSIIRSISNICSSLTDPR